MTAASEVAYLSRALKAPRIRQTAASLAEQARAEGWDYQALNWRPTPCRAMGRPLSAP